MVSIAEHLEERTRIILTIEGAYIQYPWAPRKIRPLCMGNFFNRLARRVSIFVATLAFLAVSTLTLAHGHVDSKSADESHCAMCMAVHSATHVVATPIITLFFTAVEDPFLTPLKSLTIAFAWPTLDKDRAPPSL
jgi:hypothetical protein